MRRYVIEADDSAVNLVKAICTRCELVLECSVWDRPASFIQVIPSPTDPIADTRILLALLEGTEDGRTLSRAACSFFGFGRSSRLFPLVFWCGSKVGVAAGKVQAGGRVSGLAVGGKRQGGRTPGSPSPVALGD